MSLLFVEPEALDAYVADHRDPAGPLLDDSRRPPTRRWRPRA